MSDIPLDPTSNRESLDLSGLFSKQWLNGQLLDSPEKLSLFDRSSQFGDGVFETILIHQGQCPLIERHIARLSAGLQKLAIQLDQAILIADMMQALEFAMQHPSQSFRMKLRISRGPSNSGYYYDEPVPNASVSESTRIIELSPLHYDYAVLKEGVKVRLCQWRLSDQPQLVEVKHLNRLDQVMARREWGGYKNKDDIFEGLMLDQRGFITEGVMSNLFWFDQAGQLHTPLLDTSGVRGVMRSEVLDQADSLGFKVHESRLKECDLADVQALFLSNALIGIVPISSIVDDGQNTVQSFPAHQGLSKIMNAIHNRLNIHL